jgi:Flp pilus assembly protein TadG
MMDAKNSAHTTGRLADWGRNLISLIRDTSGNVLVITALSAPILLGMAALGFDVISWYMIKRDAQTIADNTALAATVELQRGSDVAKIKTAAAAHAAHSGFVDGTDGKITVNLPPQAGPHAGDNMFVEVIVEQQGTYLLSAAMFKEDGTTITSRAVGGLYSGGNYCVLALDTSESGAISFMGNSTAELGSCSVASNSTHNSAMILSGDTLTADIAQAVGGISYTQNAINLTYHPPREGAPPAPDPYDDLTIIPDATYTNPPCDYMDVEIPNNDTATLNPGVYCGGIKINSNATVDFNPGVYLLISGPSVKDGDFDVMTGTTLNGTDVTFLLSDDERPDIGTIRINGSANINLSAPDQGHTYGPYNGDYAGILFYVDRRSPPDNAHKFLGGATMSLQGALYAPTTELSFQGGVDIDVGCLQVIGRTVTFTGNSHVTAVREDCGALGARTVGLDLPSLFE